MTIGAVTSARTDSTSFNTPRRLVPAASARSVARWITGPSASGSENGTPTSRTSAPARSSAFRISADRARSGSPAVTYVTSPGRFSARSRSNVLASRDMFLHGVHVLVAAAGEIDQNQPVRSELTCEFGRVRDGVCRLQRRKYPFMAGQHLEPVDRLGICRVRVLGAPERAEPRVLWTDRRVIETRRHGMGQLDVAVGILQDER